VGTLDQVRTRSTPTSWLRLRHWLAVTFQSYTTGNVANSDGVTGTVTVVNGNTATIAVTVPKVRSGDTGDHLTASATPGQNAITLQSITNSSVAGPILVGDSLTIEPDAFYLDS